MTTPEQLLERLAAAERAATGPPAETGERVWSAIETRLGQGPAPPELDQGPLLDSAAAEVGGAAGGSSAVGLKIVGALAIVGIVGGGWALSRERDPDPREAAPVVAASAPESPEPESPEHKSPEPESPEPKSPEPKSPEPKSLDSAVPEPEPPAPEEPTGATSKPRARPKAPARPRSLAEEVALMQALSTALKQGDSQKALKLVAEHERDFGEGQFIEERRAAKARALCQSGKLAAGKKEAASFVARWPGSIHLASVNQDCGLD